MANSEASLNHPVTRETNDAKTQLAKLTRRKKKLHFPEKEVLSCVKAGDLPWMLL
jgi:hypothetical protein